MYRLDAHNDITLLRARADVQTIDAHNDITLVRVWADVDSWCSECHYIGVGLTGCPDN